MGEAPDFGHRLEQPEEVRLPGDDAGDRPIRVGQQALEGSQIGSARCRPVGDERDLLDDQAATQEVGRHRLAVVAMNRP